MPNYTGEYGGVVVREIKNAGGKRFIAGAILTPEDVAEWPLANRMAFHKAGLIDWYGPPAEAETKARAAGRPAPARRVTKAPVEKPARPTRAPRK